MESPNSSRNQRYHRVPNLYIVRQQGSPRHLRILSLPGRESVYNPDMNGNNTEYTFEATVDAGSFVYVMDSEINFNHIVSTSI